MRTILVTVAFICSWIDPGSAATKCFFAPDGKEYCRINGQANCGFNEAKRIYYNEQLPVGKKYIRGTGRDRVREVHNHGSVTFKWAKNNVRRKRTTASCMFYCSSGMFQDAFVYGYCQVQVEPW